MSVKGNFTLPGETGCEKLALELCERWGADVIRDSDGTRLSPELLKAGYRVYSTLCPIREHNPFLKAHPECRQQVFLSSFPVTAQGESTVLSPLEGFFTEQFEMNVTPEALRYMQVWDRTGNRLLERDEWTWADGKVTCASLPGREYTVSFLAWRIWEEISMYNHVTNHWDKEHLLVLDPYSAPARNYLLSWMKQWLEDHPDTNVVRFTSLFYNFAWIWGADERNRSLFTDWASYDFTVSPEALADFEKEYGYALTAEDFVRKGKYNATHVPPTPRKKDWMAFVGRFVRGLARELTDLTHQYGKDAYVFYDDSWVGLEPWNGHFEEMGFDGLIKCVFSGFEVRLCGGVPARVHEIRFHPYLFPVGLGGAPTFSPGGHPGKDALDYWIHVRRAMLRQKIDRTGLGGYLHLIPEYPDFVSAMDQILNEFREISALHDEGAPEEAPLTVGILTSWGSLRSWTLSGHFHETYMHPLIHVLESLSGLPYKVRFLSFEDVNAGALKDVDAVINCGWEGTAWSGGDAWRDPGLTARLTSFVQNGGVFIGIGEPTAAPDGWRNFRCASLFGVDRDDALYACHGEYAFTPAPYDGPLPRKGSLGRTVPVRLLDGETRVLYEEDGRPLITCRKTGKGYGLYLAGFAWSPENTHVLDGFLRSFLPDPTVLPACDQAAVDCAVFPASGKLVLCSSSLETVEAVCRYRGKTYTASLEPCGMKVLPL